MRQMAQRRLAQPEARPTGEREPMAYGTRYGTKNEELALAFRNIGAFVHNAVVSHKEKQVKEATGNWMVLTQAWNQALEQANGDQQKATQIYKANPAVQGILGNPKILKQIYKALNVDLLNPGKSQVYLEGMQRAAQISQAGQGVKDAQQKVNEFKQRWQRGQLTPEEQQRLTAESAGKLPFASQQIDPKTAMEMMKLPSEIEAKRAQADKDRADAEKARMEAGAAGKAWEPQIKDGIVIGVKNSKTGEFISDPKKMTEDARTSYDAAKAAVKEKEEKETQTQTVTKVDPWTGSSTSYKVTRKESPPKVSSRPVSKESRPAIAAVKKTGWTDVPPSPSLADVPHEHWKMVDALAKNVVDQGKLPAVTPRNAQLISAVSERAREMGWTGAGPPTSGMRDAAAWARKVVGHIDDVTDLFPAGKAPAGVKSVYDLIDRMGGEGKLGALAGRYNDFMAGRVGAGDAEYASLRAFMGFLETAAMRPHVGARGGVRLLDHFKGLFDVSKMDADTLSAGVRVADSFMRSYATLDQISMKPSAPAGEKIVVTPEDMK